MNFLAHLALTPTGNPLQLIGNFAGDFVKGRNLSRFPAEVEKGIKLHRAIDSYTDSHPSASLSAALYRPAFGKYSGVVSDIIFDHLLSINWTSYYNLPRNTFIEHAHRILSIYHQALPPRAQRLVPSLIYQNYLSAYASFGGLERVLRRMALRTSLPNEADEAIAVTKENYPDLNKYFNCLYPDLQQHIEKYAG